MDKTLHSYIYNYIPIQVYYSSIERTLPALSFMRYTFFFRKPQTFRVISKYVIYVKKTPNFMKIGTMRFSVMLNTNLDLFS